MLPLYINQAPAPSMNLWTVTNYKYSAIFKKKNRDWKIIEVNLRMPCDQAY